MYGGMGAFIEIKDDSLNRPYSYLPDDFPRCGNYKTTQMPKIKSDEPTGDGENGTRLAASAFFLIIAQIFAIL